MAMVLRRKRVARMTDVGELCRLARKDEPDIAQVAMDRLVELLGTEPSMRSGLTSDDLRWLDLAARLRLRDAYTWRESLAVIRAMDVFGAHGRWYPVLSQLMTGQAAIMCPGCGQRLILRRSPRGLGLVIINGVVHELTPVEPETLAAAERRFHDAVAAERPDLGELLRQLLSPLVCPGCGTHSRLTPGDA